MAAKPMPRLRAGISGTPVLSSAKRSLPLHVKSKSEGRGSSRHAIGGSSALAKKGTHSPVNRCDKLSTETSIAAGDDKSSFNFSNEQPHTSSQSTWEKVCSQLDFSAKNPGLEKLKLSLDDSNIESSDSNPDSEALRLKQLMMLQISLISRQQDLLKLRDKEIMQLKQATQSYKSRLERMERRIQLSRRQYATSSVNLHKNLKSTENHEDGSEVKTVPKDTEMETNTPLFNLTPLKSTSTSSDSSTSATAVPSKQAAFPVDLEKYSSPISENQPSTTVPSMEFTSPVSLLRSAYAASGCIPVPASYVDRIKSQLPLPTEGNISSQPVVIKVCEHCTQCTALMDEIKREIAISDQDLGLGVTKFVITEEKVKLDPSGANVEVPDKLPKSPEDTVLQAKHPYHLLMWPREDQSYRFTDLELTLEEGSVLNIPTWKINKLTPLPSHSASSHVKETIDDDTLLKRHSRLEVAEKRRKRWDIQRIREYRYNEKLRQRKLKQTGDSAFETFSPSLNDITAVQVEETLPVNLFGHLLQPLHVEEFSLDSNL